jgi:hypothetical protein
MNDIRFIIDFNPPPRDAYTTSAPNNYTFGNLNAYTGDFYEIEEFKWLVVESNSNMDTTGTNQYMVTENSDQVLANYEFEFIEKLRIAGGTG